MIDTDEQKIDRSNRVVATERMSRPEGFMWLNLPRGGRASLIRLAELPQRFLWTIDACMCGG